MNVAEYKLFLGYDPGGKGKHGVAVAHIAGDGTFESDPETDVLQDAGDVCDWADEHSSEAAALGIDTLLAWSLKGERKCDEMLRKHYPEYKKSVIAQNSLRSAMTVNGASVALHWRNSGIPLVESHPKLVLHCVREDPEAKELLRETQKLPMKPNDHEADALVAAWCASRWAFGHWRVDLYATKDDVDNLRFPAGQAVYPWLKAGRWG